MNPESPLVASSNADSLVKLMEELWNTAFTNQTVLRISTSDWTYAVTRICVYVYLMIT